MYITQVKLLLTKYFISQFTAFRGNMRVFIGTFLFNSAIALNSIRKYNKNIILLNNYNLRYLFSCMFVFFNKFVNAKRS